MLYMRRVDIQLMHEVHLASRDTADGGGRQGATRTTRTMQRRRATTHTHTQRDEERERKRRRRRERAKADGEERKAKKEEKKAARAESVSQYADNTAQRRRGDLIRGGEQAAGGAWRPGVRGGPAWASHSPPPGPGTREGTRASTPAAGLSYGSVTAAFYPPCCCCCLLPCPLCPLPLARPGHWIPTTRAGCQTDVFSICEIIVFLYVSQWIKYHVMRFRL
uniref:Uncharacterized protein n=1 Tax=Coccidioides posadasii RMSCC 3488 TaxID=454284 RepID=A0A0J6EZ66_COCPO|nr:hypothetical protein CPAG_02218 [Coccidioides posadasii RMSCC 3488]